MVGEGGGEWERKGREEGEQGEEQREESGRGRGGKRESKERKERNRGRRVGGEEGQGEERSVCESEPKRTHTCIPTGVYLTSGLSSSGATYIAVPTRPVSPAHHNMSNGHVISCDGHVISCDEHVISCDGHVMDM